MVRSRCARCDLSRFGAGLSALTKRQVCKILLLCTRIHNAHSAAPTHMSHIRHRIRHGVGEEPGGTSLHSLSHRGARLIHHRPWHERRRRALRTQRSTRRDGFEAFLCDALPTASEPGLYRIKH